MAITTYTELQAAIADWLVRADLTTQIVNFIALTESRLARAFDIRTMETDAAITGVAGSRFIALPTGYRSPMALWLNRDSGRDERRLVTPEQLETSTAQGEPQFWAVDGTNIAFERPCDQAYPFTIREMIGLALSVAAPTNLILTNYPDLYLFGALLEAGGYLQDADMESRFGARFQAALTEARWKENRSRSLAPLRTEVAQVTGRQTFDIRTGT